MQNIKLGLRENRTEYEPAAELSGTARWDLDRPPRRVDVRLVWSTRGKGTEDAGVAGTVAFDAPLASESRPFSMRLPDGPYSFSGKLISLIWAVELVAEPGDLCDRIEITVAPGGREVMLPQIKKE